MEQSNIVGLLKGNDVTKSKRKQGDGVMVRRSMAGVSTMLQMVPD